jgi:hypothetical protein
MKMLKKAVILRIKENKNQTLGKLFLFDNLDEIFTCYTLELSWHDNKKNISSIPTGVYNVRPRTSKKFNKHFIVNDVNFRTNILIHPANYYYQLQGCIALGQNIFDINDDNEYDLTHSRATVNKLVELCPDGFTLFINKIYGT